MMTAKVLSVVLTLGIAAAPVVAHHSFGVAFDAAKTVTLTGTITKIEWSNPHTHIYADVKDDVEGVVSWKFEGYPRSPTTSTRHFSGTRSRGGTATRS
jgi:hypothetical protein